MRCSLPLVLLFGLADALTTTTAEPTSEDLEDLEADEVDVRVLAVANGTLAQPAAGMEGLITTQGPATGGGSGMGAVFALGMLGIGGAAGAGYFMSQQRSVREDSFEYEYDEDFLEDNEYFGEEAGDAYDDYYVEEEEEAYE